MKKFILTMTTAVAVIFAANAQTEKGKLVLGGNVSYDHSEVKDADIKVQSLTILPSIGYFVNDNFAIGTGIGYSFSESDVKESTFRVAPYARAYKGEGSFKFFGQLSVPMGWGNIKADDDTKLGTTATYGAQLSPGFAYFPTSRIGVELSVRGLYFEHNEVKGEGSDAKTSTNSFGLNADSFAPSIGVQFYF